MSSSKAKSKDNKKKKNKKKILIAAIAAGSLVAAGAIAAGVSVSLTSKSASKNAAIQALAEVDNTGNVTWTGQISLDGDINDASSLSKAYGVYDQNGNKVDATIVADPASQLPAKKGQKIKVKITYSIPDYDNTKEYKDTVNKVAKDDAKGSKVADIDVKKGGTDPTVNPDYVSTDSTLKMGAPKQIPVYLKNSDGTYTGYDKDGNTYKVNDHGYLVDSTGTPDGNKGYGQRVAGLDKDGNPLKDKDGKTIYLDDNGYRIEYSKDSTGKTEWHRVSNDGKQELGPNSGSSAWRVNDGKDANGKDLSGDKKIDPSVAPYESVDKDGNITYLDGNGNPVDTVKEKDGKPNPNYGKPIKDSSPISSQPKFTDGDSAEAKEAQKTYSRKQTSGWSLNGSVSTKMGSKAKNGSIVVGERDGLKDGKAVALNPSDSSSHQWQTIKSGKYAGMQVKIDDNGNVDFQWPVTNKQVDDIISGSGKKNSNPSDSSPLNSDGKIDLPIGFTDGKDGTGKKLPGGKTVSVTTPWDASGSSSTTDSKDSNSAYKWWIDSSMMDDALKYDDLDGTTLRVYLSSSLYKHMSESAIRNWKTAKSINLETPKLSDEDAMKVNWTGLKEDSEGMHYLELSIKPKMTYLFNKQENETLTFNEDVKDGFHIIDGASELSGTNSAVSLALTKIKDDVTFEQSEVATNNLNTVTFKVDQNAIAGDVDFSKDPQIFVTSKPDSKNSDGRSESIESSGLLASDNGMVWDANTKEITLKFKDGVLNKGQYKLNAEFFIKNSKNPNLKMVSKQLVVDKYSASDVEESVTAKNPDISFTGYQAKWTGFILGSYVLTGDDNVKVAVEYADSKSSLINSTLPANDVTWDGNSLSFKAPDVINAADNKIFTVKATFKLAKDFGEVTLGQDLHVKKDGAKSIRWTENSSSSLTFGTDDFTQLTMSDDDSNDFNVDKVDAKKSSVIYKGDVLTNADYHWDVNDQGILKIYLNKEIAKQDKPLQFIISLIDKSGNIANPAIVDVAKDKAMTTASQIAWNKIHDFENDSKDTASAIYSVTDKSKLVDINWSTLKVTSENGAILPEGSWKQNWDPTTGTLKITITKEVKKADYKFSTQFDLTKGYTTKTSTEVIGSKDTPLSSSMAITINQTSKDIDEGHTAQFTIIGTVPPAVDLNDPSQMSISLANPDPIYEGVFDRPSYDATSKTISFGLLPGKEIPGGSQDINIYLGFHDWNNYGYGKGSAVAATGTVVKTTPTEGYADISWSNSAIHISSDTDDSYEADFKLDEKVMSKHGIDVSTDKLVKLEEKIGNGEWADITGSKPTADGTTYKYENGTLKIIYTSDVMKTVSLHTSPRQYQVYLGIGNGYENTSYGQNNKDGIKSKQILTVQKDKATSYEKDINVEGANTTENINQTNSYTWNVTYFGSAIDIANYDENKTKVTWTKDPKDVPIDPSSVTKVNSDGSMPGAKTKDPNNHMHIKATDVNDNSKDKRTAKVTVSFDSGSLWGDTYTIHLVYKVQGYDEFSNVDLKVVKTAPNGEETVVDPADGNKWSANRHFSIKPSNNWLIATAKFKKFGGAIDPINKPTIAINGGIIKDSRWYFISRSYDSSSKLWTYNWETWGDVDLGTYDSSKDPSLTIQFSYAGFDGKSDAVKLVWK